MMHRMRFRDSVSLILWAVSRHFCDSLSLRARIDEIADRMIIAIHENKIIIINTPREEGVNKYEIDIRYVSLS